MCIARGHKVKNSSCMLRQALYITRKLHNQVASIAADENRSFSKMAIMLIGEAIAARKARA